MKTVNAMYLSKILGSIVHGGETFISVWEQGGPQECRERELERSFFDSRIDFGLDLWLCIDVAESLTLVLVF